MTLLAILRHAPSLWNAEKRLQGQRDVALSEAGRAALRCWRLPDQLAHWRWYASPLWRARETAALLGLSGAELEPRLMEASWGLWEGEALLELRQRHGLGLAQREARGLDFRPPGGESPRDLQKRLLPFLRRVAATAQPTGAIAHKGVIRALYCLASGWDMVGKPPIKLGHAHLHRFRLDEDGQPRIVSLNEPLAPR